MIRWTPKLPSLPTRRWQSRAEILKAHLDSLSPDELRSRRPDYYWLRFGHDAWKRRQALKANFNPSQPRDEYGRWADAGAGARTHDDGSTQRAVFIQDEADSGTGPNALMPSLQYVASKTRVTIDYSKALTGISTIDDTTKKLGETLAQTMEAVNFIPEWTPQQYGTAVHVAFGTMVRLAGFPGIGFKDVEHSFIDRQSADYGQPGSIRTDVVLRNEVGDIIAIYDVKTGGAKLTAARVRELREKTKIGSSVPIIELHVIRGASLKGVLDQQGRTGFVIARLWNPQG